LLRLGGEKEAKTHDPWSKRQRDGSNRKSEPTDLRKKGENIWTNKASREESAKGKNEKRTKGRKDKTTITEKKRLRKASTKTEARKKTPRQRRKREKRERFANTPTLGLTKQSFGGGDKRHPDMGQGRGPQNCLELRGARNTDSTQVNEAARGGQENGVKRRFRVKQHAIEI